MDARSVLSCLPFPAAMPGTVALDGDEFVLSLVRSYSGAWPGLHSTVDLLTWITDARTRIDVELEPVRLDRLPDWHYDGDRIAHRAGRFFEVIGVRVAAAGREVGGWDQPMIAATDLGLIVFLVSRINGVLHIFVSIRVEPGYSDIAELAPTVQCTPRNYEAGGMDRPPFLDEVLQADPATVRFDTVLSEEGGRFFHTRNRYLIVETGDRLSHPDFRWMTVHQLAELLRHSHYVNVQARSLLACLGSLATVASATVGAGEVGR
jgi:oxidase EvaA